MDRAARPTPPPSPLPLPLPPHPPTTLSRIGPDPSIPAARAARSAMGRAVPPEARSMRAGPGAGIDQTAAGHLPWPVTPVQSQCGLVGRAHSARRRSRFGTVTAAPGRRRGTRR